MTLRKLAALFISGMMYAAIACGSLAVIWVVVSNGPQAWEYIATHGIAEVLVMATLMLVMGLLFIALGWCGVELSRLTYGGITKGWDK